MKVVKMSEVASEPAVARYSPATSPGSPFEAGEMTA